MTKLKFMQTSVDRRQQPSVANLVKRISQDLQSKTPAASTVGVAPAISGGDIAVRKGAGDLRNRRAKVVFSYTPDNDDELRLEMNDIVEILGEEEEGWWRGRIKGKEKEGVFPTNYVKLIDPNETTHSRPESRNEIDDKTKIAVDSADTSTASTTIAHQQQELIQPKKVHGVGFGNIFSGDNKFELRKSVGVNGGGSASNENVKTAVNRDSINKPITNGRKPLQPSTDASHKSHEYAKAVFAYEAENDDELTLKENDIIIILSKTCEDPGWWQGEVISSGKHGVFPDNFVELMTPEEVEKYKKTTIASTTAAPPLVPAKPVKLVGPIRPVTPESKPDRPAPPEKSTSSSFVKMSSPGSSAATAATVESKEKSPPEIVADKSADKFGPLKKPSATLPSSIINSGKPKASVASSISTMVTSVAKSPTTANEEKIIKSVDERDAVAPLDAERLTHPTALRPRNPNKRPPSQAFLKDMAPVPVEMASDQPDGSTSVLPVKANAPLVPLHSSILQSDYNAKVRAVDTVGGGGEYVRREDYDKLKNEFESFKREVNDRLKYLEKVSSSSSIGKNQKM